MSNRHLIYTIFGSLILCSCALKPLYQKKSGQTALTKQHHHHSLTISLTGNNTEAYIVSLIKNSLYQSKFMVEKYLNDDALLHITLKTEIGSVGISQTGDTVRNQGRMHAHVKLKSRKDHRELIEPISLDAVSSFNLEASDEFANESASQAVMQRLMTEISEKLIRDVIARLQKQPSVIKK